jgi:hypothetical protein
VWFGMAACVCGVAPAPVDVRVTGAGQEERWIALFDGKSLDGWTPKITKHKLGENYADTFRVVDGLLTVSYDKYEKFDGQFGHLFCKTPYSHYRLRVEYRFVGEPCPGGPSWAIRNSGVMFHCQPPESMRVEQEFPVSIEGQFLGGLGKGERTTANVCTPGTHIVMGGKLVTQHCNSAKSKTYDGDQWVTVEFEVHGGGVIKHIIEGQTVIEYEKAQLDPGDRDGKRAIEANGGSVQIEGGYISLQSESHPIQFRKVELLPIDAGSP